MFFLLDFRLLNNLLLLHTSSYKSDNMKKIIIIGATSGIGYEIARIYKDMGWHVGVAGRRIELLNAFREQAPEQIEVQQIDVTAEDASGKLLQLIGKVGGMDLFLLCSGIGSQNRALDQKVELATVNTNAMGFTRMVTTAYQYFREQGGGHLAVISSIAGTKGIGIAPSYSATKRYQNTYMDALAQLAGMEMLPIVFTDIRPGFVKTDLLKNDQYPLLMKPEKAALLITKALQRKKRRAIIDWRYAILVFFWKLIPPFVWERLSIHN